MRTQKIISNILFIMIVLTCIPASLNAEYCFGDIAPCSARDIPILRIEIFKYFADLSYHLIKAGIGPFGVW
ncbi:MAG: hypothetical protein A2161_01670 [Candidatus Schekmanbacteria bacterium RBG_13_48_7]|uniref:Uncharacterized protein n=1 Tax=Candidatus Schekmanbacteria bacterium RBG_13_48_7 TaxID=1817878 RepID=A0A1F7S1P8_9BACT|nr:MAG: hypothetical protein A2161_01670 [Candidatus Schekmanbacteria bacterium RBG_13_48_7]